MTGLGQPGDASTDPSWSLETLADLQAGALDEPTSAELWPRVKADPAAVAVLHALDDVHAELSALAELPAPAMPTDVADRIDAALAQLPPLVPTAPPVSTAPPRANRPDRAGPGEARVVDIATARRRRRRLGWTVGLATAAAVVIGVGIGLVALPRDGSPGANLAGPTSSDATGARTPLAISGSELTGGNATAALSAALKRQDNGPLSASGQLSACLYANGVAAGVRPAGATPVVLDGKAAELLVLPTGRAAQFRLLVVGPGCGVDGAQRMADTVVGGLPTGPSSAPGSRPTG